MATPTQAFPREGLYVAGVPHVVHEFPTKAAAEEFVAANAAFSLDAKDAAPDALTAEETGAALPETTDAPDVAPIAGDAGEGA